MNPLPRFFHVQYAPVFRRSNSSYFLLHFLQKKAFKILLLLPIWQVKIVFTFQKDRNGGIACKNVIKSGLA